MPIGGAPRFDFESARRPRKILWKWQDRIAALRSSECPWQPRGPQRERSAPPLRNVPDPPWEFICLILLGTVAYGSLGRPSGSLGLLLEAGGALWGVLQDPYGLCGIRANRKKLSHLSAGGRQRRGKMPPFYREEVLGRHHQRQHPRHDITPET